MFGKLTKMGKDALAKANEAVNGKKEEEKPAEEEQPAEEPEAKQEEEAGGPARLSSEEAAARASAIRAAIEGAGTDEEAVIKAMADLNYVQAAQLKDAYTALGHNLVEDIEGDFRGNLEKALVCLTKTRAEFIADEVKKGVKGMGADEKRLANVLCTSSDEELRAADREYRTRHEGIMLDEVESDTSGTFKKAVIGALRAALSESGRPVPEGDEKVDEDVIRLYKAGEDKIGTNEAVFQSVIAENGRPYVKVLRKAYAKKYGKNLAKVIEKELSGDGEYAFRALVRPVHETYGDALHRACDGAGTDTSVVIRIICGQRDSLNDMNEYMLDKYDTTLEHLIKSETSGDLEDLLVAVIQANVE